MAFLIELIVAGQLYSKMNLGTSSGEIMERTAGHYCPLVVIASILIFYVFSHLDVKKGFSGLSGITFYIYLFHAGVWDLLQKVFFVIIKRKIPEELNAVVWIPILTVIVFLLSYFASRIWLWFWDKIDRKKRVTNRLLQVVRLESR